MPLANKWSDLKYFSHAVVISYIIVIIANMTKAQFPAIVFDYFILQLYSMIEK